MIRKLILLPMLLLAAGSCLAQTQSDLDRAKRSDQIADKVYQLDLLNQILPLLLTRDQLMKLLPPVEKARQKVREQQKFEFEKLTAIESKVDAEIKRGVEKGEVPSRAILGELNGTIFAFRALRSSIAEDNTDTILAVFKTVLNAGQLKAAMNALASEELGVDKTKLKDEEKLRLYVKEVFLHPLTYEVLKKLSMRAQ